MFVPPNHPLTLKYVRLFNLSLLPATPIFQAKLIYARGRRLMSTTGRKLHWPYDLTASEQALGRRGLWDKFLRQPLAELGDVTAASWPSDQRLAALDDVSAAEYLSARGASPEAIELLRVGYLDMYGDGIESYSALQLLLRLALAQHSGKPLMITGGSDQLPKAFAAELGGQIRYDSPVVRIEPGERSASVVVAKDGKTERLTADHVICAIPFSVLKDIEVSPPFSPKKRRVIEELSYTSVLRVFLQFRRKIWQAENLYIQTTTDLPLRWIFEHTVNQPGREGILEAQAFGADARRLCELPESERIEFALQELEKIFPGLRAEYETGTTICWDDQPWARGAFAYFRPGQMFPFRPELARPEGRVHFAGDHTSIWSGWMQGALESGLRAAHEVRATA